MVHIDPETLRRHPILGVLIGAAMIAVVGWLLHSGWSEARELLGQRAPDRVSLHETVNLSRIRWVTVSEGRWDCARTVANVRRPGLERWLMGKVESTEVPITGTVDGEVLVARFDGAVACESRAGSPLTGVVGSTVIFGGSRALRRWGEGGDRVAVLQVGESPRSAWILMLGLMGIAALGIVFAGFYLTLLLRSRQRLAETVPAFGPIEPR